MSGYIKLHELGERKLVELIVHQLKMLPHVKIGPGKDDAAVLDLGLENYLVITTDMMAKKTHIPNEMTSFQIGKNIITITVSDLAAMGAAPVGIVVSLGFPKDTEAEVVKEISEGMNESALEYGTCVVGGHTGQSDELTLTGTAVGIVPKDQLLTRSGAKPSDIAAVSGSIGTAAAGLQILLKKLEVDPKERSILVKAALEPKARVKEACALADAKCVTAATDITDGLAWSLHELSIMSNVGFTIEEKNLPILSPTKKVADLIGSDLIDLTSYIGGDYELLLTIKPDKWKIAEEAIKKVGGQLFKIGITTEDKELKIIRTDGRIQKIQPKGYDHFIISPSEVDKLLK